MPLFDNIAKAAKDFFIEETSPDGPSVAAPQPLPGTPAPLTAPSSAPLATPASPLLTQPEQRHLDHIRGRLWVESQAGHGSRFLFTLPIAG